MTLPKNLDLIEFIARSNETQNAEELKGVFLDFLKGCGMDRFIMGQISHESTTAKERHMDIIANYPQDWLSY